MIPKIEEIEIGKQYKAYRNTYRIVKMRDNNDGHEFYALQKGTMLLFFMSWFDWTWMPISDIGLNSLKEEMIWLMKVSEIINHLQ